MEDLLPYYERELAFLRRHSREFAERYPKIAARLLLSGEGCDDPHVERMIESFALLSARINKKLNDEYSQFTEALLQVLYPHYLRPFPSCSIACFQPGEEGGALSEAMRIPRGTELASRPVKGVACRFRTAYDMELFNLQLAAADFEAAPRVSPGLRLPKGATGAFTIRLESPAKARFWKEAELSRLRVYIDAEASVAAALRDCLYLHVIGTHVSSGEGSRWIDVGESVIGEVGFSEQEALIPFPPSSHPAYRHLTEYFAFPEKFNFFDIDLARVLDAFSGGDALVLHLALADIRADSHAARLLETVSAANLRLFCTPVVNLFPQRGDPIRLSHASSAYPVVADGRKAFAYEVYSIDAVSRVRQTPQGETVTEFRPFFSLRHGETASADAHYWFARRNELVAERSPGYETEITIVDIDFDPASPQTETLSLELHCTNRDLPAHLSLGLPGGDLFLEGGSVARSIRLLRKPSRPWRFEQSKGAQWRLVSHLSLNHLSLAGSGVDAFKEMLMLYDLPRTPSSRRQIDSIVAVSQEPQTRWMQGNPFASFVRGNEVRLTVDEQALVGSGLDLFARVIDRFLGLYVHANSFSQLVVISNRTGAELIRCVPRSGESILA